MAIQLIRQSAATVGFVPWLLTTIIGGLSTLSLLEFLFGKIMLSDVLREVMNNWQRFIGLVANVLGPIANSVARFISDIIPAISLTLDNNWPFLFAVFMLPIIGISRGFRAALKPDLARQLQGKSSHRAALSLLLGLALSPLAFLAAVLSSLVMDPNPSHYIRALVGLLPIYIFCGLLIISSAFHKIEGQSRARHVFGVTLRMLKFITLCYALTVLLHFIPGIEGNAHILFYMVLFFLIAGLSIWMGIQVHDPSLSALNDQGANPSQILVRIGLVMIGGALSALAIVAVDRVLA